jgi:hypothetical protein
MALMATVIGGCATMNVSSHVERGLDFSGYRTFAWGAPDELPTGDPRLDRDTFFKDHMQGAVEKQFAHHGIALSDTPDLRVHYHASITTRMNVSRVDTGRGYCPAGNCGAELSEYEAGTLVLDIVDARTNRVIWRGWAQDALGDMLEDRDDMEKKINDAITRILARWPGNL